MGTLTFLGTGTSTGVPMIGCRCKVCLSDNVKDSRLRSSVWVRAGSKSILVDTSTDLREQALRAGIEHVNAVLYTHHHADHVHGIDELRSFNFLQNEDIPLFGNAVTMQRLESMFGYIFNGEPYEGGGIPKLEINIIEAPFTVGDVKIIPVPVMHGSLEVYGYRVNDTAYVTDCSKIPDSSTPLLDQLDTLILGALGLPYHATHFTLEKALEAIEILKPKHAYLTHLNHNLGHETTGSALPDGVQLAWDGLTIDI